MLRTAYQIKNRQGPPHGRDPPWPRPAGRVYILLKMDFIDIANPVVLWYNIYMKRTCRVHGLHDKWRDRGPKGYDCRKCNSERSARSRKARMERDSEYADKIRAEKGLDSLRRRRKKNYEVIAKFSEEKAKEYKEACDQGFVRDYREFIPGFGERDPNGKVCPSCGSDSHWRTREHNGRKRTSCRRCKDQFNRNKNKLLLSRGGVEGPWSCECCGLENSERSFFDGDHRVPRSAGGDNSVENLQILCPNCHRVKSIAEQKYINI